MSSRVRTSTKKGNKLYVDKDSKTNIKKKRNLLIQQLFI